MKKVLSFIGLFILIGFILLKIAFRVKKLNDNLGSDYIAKVGENRKRNKEALKNHLNELSIELSNNRWTGFTEVEGKDYPVEVEFRPNKKGSFIVYFSKDKDCHSTQRFLWSLKPYNNDSYLMNFSREGLSRVVTCQRELSPLEEKVKYGYPKFTKIRKYNRTSKIELEGYQPIE